MIKESKFDQIFDAQNVFRIILESYSHPGLLYSFDEYRILQQDFWLASNAIIALSLFDNNVSFHVVDPNNQALIEEYIHLNTSAKLSSLKEADYIFLDGKDDLTRILKDAKIGELSYPEKNATIIMSAGKLSNRKFENNDCILNLSGPGIENSNLLYIEGLNTKNIESFQSINAEFPLGLDLILVDQLSNICSIPRSISIEIL